MAVLRTYDQSDTDLIAAVSQLYYDTFPCVLLFPSPVPVVNSAFVGATVCSSSLASECFC